MQYTVRNEIRWPLALAMVLATCLTASLAFGQQQKLVPANYTARTDSQGYTWDFQPYGQINNGTNSCFSSAAALTVNGSSFSSPQSALMTPDGSELVFSRQMSSLMVTRRIKLDRKAAAVRYVETIHNPTSAPVIAQVWIKTSLGRSQGQALVTDRGTPVGTALGEKDSGLVLFAQPSTGQLSVVFHLGGARSKIKPTIQNQSNAQFVFKYTLNIEAGKKASIIHGIAQRRLTSVPDAKVATKLLKPFTSRSWTRDLAKEIRRSIVNLGQTSFGAFGDDDSFLTLESLGIEPQAADVLAVGEETRLHGTTTCKSFSIETRYGTLKLPIEKVAAIAGKKFTGGKPRVFLVDGQVFNGPITVEGLRFIMNSGLQLDLEADNFDRLLMHSGLEGKAADGIVALLDTTTGDRLALTQTTGQRVTTTTPWGRRKVSLDDILQMYLSDQKVGHHLVLRDGSRLFGFASGSTLSLETLYFGQQEFVPAQVQRLSSARLPSSQSYTNEEIAASHLLLAGDNVLVGQVDLAAIHFFTSGQQIPVPPSQIRVLRNVGAESSSGGSMFEGELWDGGAVRGTLVELVLPVRSADLVAQVPLHDVREIHVPSPVVPDTMRNKIAQMIRDLGHPEYDTRKAAKESLAELGHLPKLQLDETLNQTNDPEVRRSVEDLLAELK